MTTVLLLYILHIALIKVAYFVKMYYCRC